MDKYVLKLIAFCQIVGAIVGGVYVYESVRFAEVEPGGELFFLALVSVLGVATLLALVAGVLLWADTTAGTKLSLVVQALQLPLITSSAFKYKLMFGLGVWICFEGGEDFTIRVQINIGASEAIAVNPDQPLLIGVNVVALFFFGVLLRTWLRERHGRAAPSAPAH